MEHRLDRTDTVLKSIDLHCISSATIFARLVDTRAIPVARVIMECHQVALVTYLIKNIATIIPRHVSNRLDTLEVSRLVTGVARSKRKKNVTIFPSGYLIYTGVIIWYAGCNLITNTPVFRTNETLTVTFWI